MQLGLDLNVGLKLEQKLSPQMIQSLKLLQVTALQLEAMVNQELEQNPLLDANDEIRDAQELDQEQEEKKKKDDQEYDEIKVQEDQKTDADWDKFFEDGFDPGYKRSEDNNKTEPKFERVPVATSSSQDKLLFQLLHSHTSSKVRVLVEYLIDCMDEDGYVKLSSEVPIPPGTAENDTSHQQDIIDIQNILLGEMEEVHASQNVREAFNVLRHMDPPGIGAKDLQECLLIQINRLGGISPLAERIVREAFPLFKKLKISAIAKKFEKSPEEIQSAIREIGHLDPKPGRILDNTVSTSIIPDLVVEIVEGEIVLYFNDKYIPSLKISRNYSSLLKKESKASSNEKKYVRDRLNSATWLIRAIEQRKTTMLKVMQAIIGSQPDFFSKGPANLKPLILQDIADKIEMHISTVSRVINGKYVQTPNGIFELKYFFSSGVAQEDGSDVSSVQVKDEIRKLVESENPKKPYSDQKIADILKTKGVEVARRTVAKYRDQLEILPARYRKTF